jgi:hypothetical protein
MTIKSVYGMTIKSVYGMTVKSVYGMIVKSQTGTTVESVHRIVIGLTQSGSIAAATGWRGYHAGLC